MREDLPDVESIRASIRDENLLGIGGFSSVYAIDGHPKYVVKIVTEAGTDLGNSIIRNPNSTTFDHFKVSEDPNLQERNFGQPVAQYFEDGDVQILLRQTGIECGVPKYLIDNDRYELAEDQQDQIYLTSLKRVAAMPQSAYVQLFQDAEFLGTIGYAIDDNFGENLLVDAEAGFFNPIDLQELGFDRENWDRTHILPSDTFSMLCGTDYYTYNSDFDDEAGILRAIILDKVLTACEELDFAFMKEHPEGNFNFDDIVDEGSPEYTALVRRILETHGSCKNFPTKDTSLYSWEHHERWKTIFEDVIGASFPVSEDDAEEYDLPFEEFSP